jgi:phosphatidate cytidylyltransferase
MKQRIITALWGIPLLVVLILAGPPTFPFPLVVLLVAFAVFVGSLEFYRLARLADGQPLTAFGVVCALAFVASAHFDNGYFTAALLASSVLLPLLWLLIAPPREKVLLRWYWTLLGILYVGWMLSHYVALRNMEEGIQWVFLAVLCTFACDTGAYFGGRAWGKHQMAPVISPKKTWEGAASGFVATVAAAVALNAIFTALWQELPVTYLEVALLGAVIGVVSQIGDLCESQLKRKAGVKDSGSLLPGHGGVLDRMDSIVFVGVVVYYYAQFIVG